MRRTTKKALAGLLLGSMAVGTVIPAYASEEKPYDGETIRVIMQAHTTTDSIQELLPQFEEMTGIDVELEVMPQEEMFDKTQIALAAGSSDYDVIMFDLMYTAQFADAGWIEELGPYVEKTGYDIDDFMPGYLNSLSYQGKLYGMPIYGESSMLMYNTEMFEQAGIEGAPKTKEEFDEAVAKLDAAGIPAIVYRGAKGHGMNVMPWTGMFLEMGGDWFDADGNLAVNSEAAVKAAEYYADLLMNHSVSGVESFNWDQYQLAIQQGKVAMCIDATNFASRLENPEKSTIVGKVGYSVIPDGMAIGWTVASGFAIPTEAQHKDAGWEFIQWALNKDSQLASCLNGDRCDPTRISVMNSDEFNEKYNYADGQWVATTIEALSTCPADYRPRIVEWLELGDGIATALSNVMQGDDAQAEFDKVQENFKDLKYPDYEMFNK